MPRVDAIGKSNNDVGAQLVEMAGREYMVRRRGYIKSLDDIGNIVVMSNPQTGTPVLVRDLAAVTFGPDMRRGVGELDGEGEAIRGVFIMRFGEDPTTTMAAATSHQAEAIVGWLREC